MGTDRGVLLGWDEHQKVAQVANELQNFCVEEPVKCPLIFGGEDPTNYSLVIELCSFKISTVLKFGYKDILVCTQSGMCCIVQIQPRQEVDTGLHLAALCSKPKK